MSNDAERGLLQAKYQVAFWCVFFPFSSCVADLPKILVVVLSSAKKTRTFNTQMDLNLSWASESPDLLV